MSDSEGSLGEGIIYEDQLPLSWRELPADPEPARLARWNLANEQVLHLVAALEEHHHEPADEHSPQAHELARLDFKINLVLELVGELLTRQLSLPAEREVKLSAQAIQWAEPEAGHPGPGAWVLITLYVHPQLPKPLTLLGEVRAAAPSGRVVAELRGVSEAVRDLLEKLIFRHHRRSIAHMRPARES